MTLLTHELKQFKANSAFVKSNGIIPILNYIKLEPGKITKNALNTFIEQAITYDGPEVLIEQDVLFAAVDDAGASIEVAIKDSSVILTSNGIKTKSQAGNIKEFPITKQPGISVTIPSEVLQHIITASNFLDENSPLAAAQTVFISANHVSGTNGHIAYYHEIETGLNNIFIPKSTCQALKGYDNLQFSENDSYQFFSNDEVKMGFSKPELKYMDLSQFFANMPDDTLSLPKQELINFNNHAIKTASSKLYTTELIAGDKVELVMIDKDYNRQSEMIIETSCEPFKFRYDPAKMNIILKSLEGETVNLHHKDNGVYITNETSKCLIMKIVTNENS